MQECGSQPTDPLTTQEVHVSKAGEKRTREVEEVEDVSEEMSQSQRAKRAATEHSMNLGSPDALTISGLQRKHGILHRTSLVRAIDKMKNEKKPGLADSVAPHVRLTQDDIIAADLERPGILQKLLRKVHQSWQTRRAPGLACTRCRLLKKRCDGSFPCTSCLVGGHLCNNRDEAKESDCPSPGIPISPEPPISIHVLSRCPPKARATDPMRPSLGGMELLVDLGWRSDSIANMIGCCPVKLRTALDRLSSAVPNMLRNPLFKRNSMPEMDDLFQSAQVARVRNRLEPDGSKVFCFNDQVAARYGVHKEEFAARMAGRDMPMWHTEYRLMCFQLEMLYHTCFNATGSFDMFLPFTVNSFPGRRQKGKEEEERWHVHRWKHVLYANGVQSTGVLITAEEFDRGMAQRSDALGVFAACAFSGDELFSARDLKQREKISAMASDEAGRRVLDELAGKIVERFGL